MEANTTVSLLCTQASFCPAPIEWVRWLAPEADIYRVQQAMRTSGLEAPAWEQWETWHQQG